MKKLKVGILGANGYVGYELVRLLYAHPKVQITYLGSRAYENKAYNEVYPAFAQKLDLKCEDKSLEQIAPSLDLVFTATPQGFAASVINEKLLNECKFIDLSADFRLKSKAIYEKWYHLEHKAEKLLKEAVYGLCEIHREEIKKAHLIANPGCYTTCSILALYPLVKEKIIDLSSIIIDAKSGVSGAGRGEKLENLFCEVNENFKAYALSNHRHTPEIEQELSLAAKENLTLQFSPHLVPMQRGILTTIYANLSQKIDAKKLKELYKDFYKNEKFVRIQNTLPEVRFVKNTNFIDINALIDERTKRVIIVAAIDNLLKGAAGQAVQNMNLIFGFEEDLGLEMIANL
ncbi:N-acetyl-gamma-glutamyl-phosphate reductase [Campylobacter sp. MIT 99-7217]|uniref:N-acetyl-gamma-glutamyl-phosphate reductase n=1 Tax=Campylobacter sp. MIT 99-7217 TaxID=535091 RepID=UPI00115ACEEE|nr:N-acetyl-gamma-glutamyl-phosphate reductase [Campylobacter sp. MIT 99-7217]TQR30350.1 N-acetyl-gamma-glutamyl-phosphate reductase [Campylobacter sp. MIT 99-7217]